MVQYMRRLLPIALLVQAARSQRIAYCLSGDLRSFAAVSWTLEARVLNATSTPIDVFAHVWTSDEPLDRAGEAALAQLGTRRRAVDAVVEVVTEPREERATRSARFYSEPELDDEARMAGKQTRAAFRSQWRKVHLAFRLATAHAARQRAEYSAFVRARPDSAYALPIDLGALHSLFSRVAAGVDESGGGAYLASAACFSTAAAQDMWAMATPRVFEAYARAPARDEPDCCEAFLAHRLLHGLHAFEVWRCAPEKASHD